jgi:hypothetical protein
MPFYIKVPLSEDGLIDTNGKLQKVETRAHASELVYSDAAHAKGVADEMWPGITWRIEHVRTGKFVVKG